MESENKKNGAKGKRTWNDITERDELSIHDKQTRRPQHFASYHRSSMPTLTNLNQIVFIPKKKRQKEKPIQKRFKKSRNKTGIRNLKNALFRNASYLKERYPETHWFLAAEH